MAELAEDDVLPIVAGRMVLEMVDDADEDRPDLGLIFRAVIVVHALPWMIARLLVQMSPIWREEMAGDMEDRSAHHGCHLGKMEH
ncbi:hypothetical protein ACLOJK_027610 [Asimina triloba]